MAFPGFAVLVGPNNAGKTTITSALRSLSQMLRHGLHKTAARWDGGPRGEVLWVHWMEEDQFGIGLENLRHEFRDKETRLEIEFSDPDLRLVAIWPIEDPPYFFFRQGGWNPSRP